MNTQRGCTPTKISSKSRTSPLDEAEQRRLYDTLVRIAERTAAAESEEEVLTRIRNALAFLVEARMREMVRDAREYELKALLTDLFGERAAAATVERLPASATSAMSLKRYIQDTRSLIILPLVIAEATST